MVHIPPKPKEIEKSQNKILVTDIRNESIDQQLRNTTMYNSWPYKQKQKKTFGTTIGVQNVNWPKTSRIDQIVSEITNIITIDA